MIDTLLSFNPNVNAITSAGHTPLHITAIKNHLVATQRLMDHGAHPSIRDAEEKTAWQTATELEHVDVANCISKTKAGQWLDGQRFGSTQGVELIDLNKEVPNCMADN